MKNLLKSFRKNTSGATAIEYGLIAALIAMVLIPSMTLLGNNLSSTFLNISGKVGVASITR
jgi:pilus assembly protein Flp/PilA